MPNSAMAAISRLVAIGRRMKISERFTIAASGRAAGRCRPCPDRRDRRRARAAALAARRRRVGLHARARLETQLAFGDDRLARLQALPIDHVVVHALRDR